MPGLRARDSWTRRIDRAADLAESDRAARPLLLAYGRLLGLQRDSAAMLERDAARLTGSLATDLTFVRPSVAPILAAVMASGPPRLAEEARQLRDHVDSIDSLLLAEWRTPERPQFFAKVILQPYAEHLAAAGVRPLDRETASSGSTCPFCGGLPQVSVLQASPDGDGGGRHLLCATCSTTWPIRRVLCPRCGEEDEHRLCYFHSPAFDHLRVDACDSCRHYLKTIDLTRLGVAVPVVDEVAGAPLDLWAMEQGYEKIELNLVGL